MRAGRVFHRVDALAAKALDLIDVAAVGDVQVEQFFPLVDLLKGGEIVWIGPPSNTHHDPSNGGEDAQAEQDFANEAELPKLQREEKTG